MPIILIDYESVFNIISQYSSPSYFCQTWHWDWW